MLVENLKEDDYLVYKTTNLINSKIYIGYHKSKDFNDGYLGSGKILKSAIKKYGKENFKREVLYIFPNKGGALLQESKIVDEDFIKRKDTYNIKLGGEGGWDYINNTLRQDNEYLKIIKKAQSNASKKAHKEGKLKGWGIINKEKQSHWNKGKPKSEETRKKMSLAKIGKKNHNTLPKILIKQRTKDYNKIEKSWGWVGKLAKEWNVSHTQVRRFINDYI